MRLCPGNEAQAYAQRIIDMVHYFDDQEDSIMEQVTQDDLDVEEIVKNQQAIMGGIVSMSKLITGMHDTMRRLLDIQTPVERSYNAGSKGTDKGNQEGTITT
jgi:hypothetical protein